MFHSWPELQKLLVLCVYRVANALVVTTYFNPDEYWQSLEVAHRAAFGYGELTWEWKEGAQIRGFLHPLLFAFFYKMAEVGFPTLKCACLTLETSSMVSCS